MWGVCFPSFVITNTEALSLTWSGDTVRVCVCVAENTHNLYPPGLVQVRQSRHNAHPCAQLWEISAQTLDLPM